MQTVVEQSYAAVRIGDRLKHRKQHRRRRWWRRRRRRPEFLLVVTHPVF